MNRQRGLAAAGAVLVTVLGVSANAGSAHGVVPKEFHVQFGATGTTATADVEDKIYAVDEDGVAGVVINSLKIGQKAELTVTQDGNRFGAHEPLLYALAPNETKADALARMRVRATQTTNRRLTGGDIEFRVIPPGTTVTLEPGTDYILVCDIVPHFAQGMFATVNENGNHVDH